MLRARTAVALLVLAGLAGPVESASALRSGGSPSSAASAAAYIGRASTAAPWPGAWKVRRTSSSARTDGTLTSPRTAATQWRRSSRDAATGRLTQLPGRRGCVAHLGAGPCAPARALARPSSLAISPDGRNVYVTAAGSNALSVFARNRRTGALTQLQGERGCLSQLQGGGLLRRTRPERACRRDGQPRWAPCIRGGTALPECRGDPQPSARRLAHAADGGGGMRGVRSPRRLRPRSRDALSRGCRGEPGRQDRLCGGDAQQRRGRVAA